MNSGKRFILHPSPFIPLKMVLWPSGSRRLPDTEEIGGSIPPRTTPVRARASRLDAACGVAVARGPVKAEVRGSTPPAPPFLKVRNEE